MIDENDPDGFGERPLAGFTHALDTHLAFYCLALSAYEYRCAVSGLQFSPQDKILHERLDVVPIHPRELGGPLEMGNALVLETSLAAAFGQGLITATDDFKVAVPRLAALSDEQRALVEPGRALLLPADPLFYPAAKRLHFHRLVIARYQK